MKAKFVVLESAITLKKLLIDLTMVAKPVPAILLRCVITIGKVLKVGAIN